MRYVLYDTLLDKVLLSQEISFMNDYIELMKLRLHACTTLEVREPKPDHGIRLRLCFCCRLLKMRSNMERVL